MASAEDEEWALSFLTQHGALEECEAHSCHFDGDKSVKDVYLIFNAMVSKGEFDLEGKSRRFYTDLLQMVHDQNSFSDKCPICEKNQEE